MSLTSYQAAAPPRGFEQRYTALVAVYAIRKPTYSGRKIDEAGIASRCQFHEGYLDSLPRTEPFNAATSILVSQFLTDPNQRRDFFHQIAKRLRPGGHLINADLASSLNSSAFDNLFEIWLRAHGHTPQAERPSQIGWGKMSLSLAQRKLSPSLQGQDLNGLFSFTRLFLYMLGTREVPAATMKP